MVKGGSYSLTLSSSNGKINETSNVETTSTALSSSASFTFKHKGLSSSNGNFASFSEGGYLLTPNGVNGLSSVSSSITSGKLYISFASYPLMEDGDWSEEYSLSSVVNAPSGKNYFKIRASEETICESITINYYCSGLITDHDIRIYTPVSEGNNYVYAWDNSSQPAGTWPGTVMNTVSDSDDNSWYTYTFSNYSSLNIIFNDGSGNQTDDLSIYGSGDHYYCNRNWYGYNPLTVKLNVNNLYVYGGGYNTVYAWTDLETLTDPWPGNTLSDDGDNWYKATFDEEELNIIFNNGSSGAGNQTDNLNINEYGNHYYYQGQWYSSKPNVNSKAKTDGLNILHCFDWSLTSIMNNIADIKEAGYDAIQTSPLQIPKDYNKNWAQYESGNWWKMYQPVSFSLGTLNTSSWLGGSYELKALTTVAKNYDIKVIVDIVCNHLAGSDSSSTYDSEVNNYESELYADSNTLHPYVSSSDTIEGIVRGNIGMPDLNTSNSKVQNRILNYLKSLIDLGVEGFRFDAAKHIETSNDGIYSSSFWENVLGGARTYASGLGVDLFAYGEILAPNNAVRDCADYINYAEMDAITESGIEYEYRNNINSKNAYSRSDYACGLNTSNVVLWGESHDNYMNDSHETTSMSQTTIDYVYALMAARKQAHLLYFTRPSGTIGTPNTNTFGSSLVVAANTFHTGMGNVNEAHYTSGSVSYVERYGSHQGVVIINPSASSKTITFTNISNGTYIDLITNSNINISSKQLNIPANTAYILEKN